MKAQQPYKSTTHEEDFVHFQLEEPYEGVNAVTVFLRREDDGVWYAADARCSQWDQFCRATGRKVSRTRYFRHPDARISLGSERPKYDDLFAWFVV